MRPNGRRQSIFLAACTAWFRLITPPKGSQTLSPFTTPQSVAWMWWTRWCGSTRSAEEHGAGQLPCSITWLTWQHWMHMCCIKHAPGRRKDGWTSWWSLQESWLTLIWLGRRQEKNSCFGHNPPHLALEKEPRVRSNTNARTIMPLCDVFTATDTHVVNADYRYHGSARIVSDWNVLTHFLLLFVNMCTNGCFFVLFFCTVLSINLSNKGNTPMCVDFSLRQTETQVSLWLRKLTTPSGSAWPHLIYITKAAVHRWLRILAKSLPAIWLDGGFYR